MQNPPPTTTTAVGQVSPDGQFRWDGMQWVPIPRGAREPTSWTRPMQLAAAGFFVVEAVYSIVTSAIFINHDTMVRVLQAQNNLPAGSDVNQIASISLFFAWAFVVVFAILWLVAAVGSYLGWRWMFWVALVLFGLGAIGALTNLANFANPDRTQVPLWGTAISEVFGIASAALFVWLLVGVITRGPWAMKRPGT